MNLDQQLFVSREAYIRTKRDMCSKHEGPYDLQPQVNVIDAEGRYSVGIVESVDLTLLAVKSLAEAMPGEVAFVVSLADTLTSEVPEGQSPMPGSLARRLAQGDPTVRDALVVTVLDVLADEHAASMVMYRYDDFGQPVFDDPIPMTVKRGESTVTDLMREAVGLV